MTIKNAFTTPEAAAVAGFSTPYMLDYLARTGVVRPSIAPSPGRGRRRLYNYSDVVLLRALGRLLERGIPVRRFKEAQRTYRKLTRDVTPGRLPARYLMTDGFRLFYTEDPARVVDLTSDGQLAFAFVVDMDPINKEVIAAVEKLPTKRRRRRTRLPTDLSEVQITK